MANSEWEQQMDSAFVNLFGATCGYGIYPKDEIYCVTEESNTNSPFGENYMLFTLGYLVWIPGIVKMKHSHHYRRCFLPWYPCYRSILTITWLSNSVSAIDKCCQRTMNWNELSFNCVPCTCSPFVVHSSNSKWIYSEFNPSVWIQHVSLDPEYSVQLQ